MNSLSENEVADFLHVLGRDPGENAMSRFFVREWFLLGFVIQAVIFALGFRGVVMAKDLTAPSAEQPWTPPLLENYGHELAQRSEQEKGAAGQTLIDPHHNYALPELIDLAERNNPDTRVAWERARQAAAAVGLSESFYYPYLAASAGMGYEQAFIPFPTLKIDGDRIEKQLTKALPALGTDAASVIKAFAKSPDLSVVSINGGGTLATDVVASRAALSVKWLLLDFGERRADMDAAKQRLMMANVGFNATHQKIVFDVTQKFYELSNARQNVMVGKVALQAAQTVEQAAQARLKNGLATKPELLEAQQQTAQSIFDLEAALGVESDAEILLVEALGIPPSMPIQVADTASLPLPSIPDRSVDAMVNLALSQRPDLVAKLANVRAQEAEVRKARANFFPKITLDAHVGEAHLDVSIADSKYFGGEQTEYGAGVVVEVPLFDGFARLQKLRLAETELRAAESELTSARNGVVSEVWVASTNFKTTLRKQDAATKLLSAAEIAYAAVLESYQHGLSTYVEVINAQRNVTAARRVGSETRSAIFTSAAALALSMGDLARPKPYSATSQRR